MYAEDVVGAEYRKIGWVRRLVLRWVSPDMAHAAKHLSQNPRAHVNVPLVGKATDGPITKAADRWLSGSR